jgi:hypothetical protein
MRPTGTQEQSFIPREHGATAMLLTPFFAAAILLRSFYWTELVALVAILCAFAIKDPLIVLGRQRFVWTQPHPETRAAQRAAMVQFVVLAAAALVLLTVRDWRAFLPLFIGAGCFTVLAVTLNVKNRQRSELFQTASAVALTATSLMACLAAEGRVPEWGWLLWALCALQAATGIFVVHARLDARIAAKKGQAAPVANRRVAVGFVCALGLAAVVFALRGQHLVAAGLAILVAGYSFDLVRQRRPEALNLPLKSVGLQALALSIVYSLTLIAGLWPR